MKANIVQDRLAEMTFRPLTNAATGRLLYELVLMADVGDVVELGFAHGTSTAYMAAALDEKGSGCVRTFDREDAREREPNLFEVLTHLGLERWVKPTMSASSYTWELMRILDDRTVNNLTNACFDFCFLDGAHTWETDGLAFLIVDRLLREDRWIVFDDVNWTLGSSPTLKDTDRVRSLPDDERSTPHVRKVLDLLVRSLGYDIRLVGNLALAYKPARAGRSERHRHDFDQLVESHPALVRELALGLLRSAESRRGGSVETGSAPTGQGRG